jgi:TIR domain-containing protein
MGKGEPASEYNPTMTLDSIGRRYAETLLADAIEESAQKLQTDLARVRSDHQKRNTLMSGFYIADHASVYLDQIKLLAEARMDSLKKAYEKSDLPFDDAAFNEIKAEVMQFCQQKQHNAVGAIRRVVTQTFQGSGPVGMEQATVEQIIHGVDGIMARLSRALSLKRDEVLLEDMKVRKAYAAGLGKQWDVFISHASEDKSEFVRPLAKALEVSGLLVWYDESTLKIGDSLRRKIEEGLAKSRYGIVVLSQHFFEKKWPQDELDGLASKEVAGTKVILPVWHNMEFAEVQRRAPMLSGRLAAKSSDGIDTVVRQLREAMGL